MANDSTSKLTGITGVLSNATLQGDSAYTVAVKNGFVGTEAEWLASLKGDTGNGISSISLNSDYTLTITTTDGSSTNVGPIRGEQGIQGIQGVKGDTGNGIRAISVGSDGYLDITMDDGTNYRFHVKGDKGDKGNKGDTGNDGISATVEVTADTDSDYRLTFTDVNGSIETPNLIPEASRFAELTDIRVGTDGTVYPSAGDAVRGQISDLKEDLIYSYSKKTGIEQGYWAIANGNAVASDSWCRTTGFVNKNAIFRTSSLRMYLLAYTLSGTYVGTWNGTEFSTTYNANRYFKEVIFKEWLDKYPNYAYKIDFRVSSGTVSPSGVLDDLTISEYASENVEFLDSKVMKSDVIGECNLNPLTFTNGSLQSGELYPSIAYRASMKEVLSLPYDITIVVKSGFKVSVNLFTNGTYTGYVGWITDTYTISKNQQFKIMIARAIENTSEVANVNEFVRNVYVKSLALKTQETIADVGVYDNLVNALTSGFRYVYHFGMSYVTERKEIPPAIPAQSIYDLRNAKNLGFKCVEANVHKTSDGHYVVTHGVNGALGHDFNDLNGDDAGTQGVIISQHTLSDLQSNYRYYCSEPSYRIPITTLEEFLCECSRLDLKVMQMYCDNASLQLGISIMGKHRIWAYAAPRSAYLGPITNYRKYTTKAEIVADCESYGIPYIYSMGNPSEFTDSELLDIAQTLHGMGYQLMSAYRTTAEIDRLGSLGWDYFILSDNSYREPVILNGKQINFGQDGSVTWSPVVL